MAVPPVKSPCAPDADGVAPALASDAAGDATLADAGRRRRDARDRLRRDARGRRGRTGGRVAVRGTTRGRGSTAGCDDQPDEQGDECRPVAASVEMPSAPSAAHARACRRQDGVHPTRGGQEPCGAPSPIVHGQPGAPQQASASVKRDKRMPPVGRNDGFERIEARPAVYDWRGATGPGAPRRPARSVGRSPVTVFPRDGPRSATQGLDQPIQEGHLRVLQAKARFAEVEPGHAIDLRERFQPARPGWPLQAERVAACRGRIEVAAQRPGVDELARRAAGSFRVGSARRPVTGGLSPRRTRDARRPPGPPRDRPRPSGSSRRPGPGSRETVRPGGPGAPRGARPDVDAGGSRR